MSKEKSIAINSIFYLSYNALNAIFPFVTAIYVAHVLLSTEIGQVESARNVAQYFVILAYLGIPTYGLREVSKAKKNKAHLDKLYSELMIINFFSTTFFSVAYFLTVIIVPAYRNNLLLYLITGIAIILNVLNNSWLFEGLEKFGYIAIRNLIFKALCFLLLLLFVKRHGDYLIYALIFVIGTAGNYAINLFSSRKFVSIRIRDLDFKRHVKPIFYLVVVNLAIEIYSLVDITMLNLFCNADHVAYYSYGLKIHRILIQIMNTFTIVLIPRIALYYKENRIKEYNELITKTLKVILMFSIPAIVGIWFVSDYIIVSIYGTEYISSAIVLKILSLILTISPIGYLLGSRVLLVTGNEKRMVIPVAIGAGVNVLLNFILIQYFYEAGAAIASIASELVVMIVYIILSHNKFKLGKMMVFIGKLCVSVIAITIYMYLCHRLRIPTLYQTILQILGTVVIYFSLLVILKEELVTSFIKHYILRIKNEN